jgi:hypothetical protein
MQDNTHLGARHRSDFRAPQVSISHVTPMTQRHNAAPTDTQQKLRQTQAEYTAARPAAEPGVRPMMSSSKMYVCRRCQANFKTGDGKPDPRLPGLGKCNNCISAAAAAT